jgi:hypothetical protein
MDLLRLKEEDSAVAKIEVDEMFCFWAKEHP